VGNNAGLIKFESQPRMKLFYGDNNNIRTFPIQPVKYYMDSRYRPMSDEEDPQSVDFADEDWGDEGDEGVIGWGDYDAGDNEDIDEGLPEGDADAKAKGTAPS
jgi:hypothetical protein